MSKLKFRVVQCNNEENGFPAAELNNHGPHTKGWQSARFAEYPIEIGMQTSSSGSKISQIQILSHQSKIATKVEIFIGDGNSYQSANFKRLGFMSLDSNERSNYQARELKTVYVDQVGSFVKFLIHKNHVNTQNYFNQVGIIAVNLIGSSSGISSESGPGNASNGSLNDLALDMNLDGQTASKLRQLAEAKSRAVASEDYATAKKIKNVESDLKNLGAQLGQIDIAKRQAVNAEDYDRARELKIEGDELRAEIERQINSINIPGVAEFRSNKAKANYSSPTHAAAEGPRSARRNNAPLEDIPESNRRDQRDYGGGGGAGGGGGGGGGSYYADENHQSSPGYSMNEYDDDGDGRPIKPKRNMNYDDADPELGESEVNDSNDNDNDNAIMYEDGVHVLDGIDKVEELSKAEPLQDRSIELAHQNGDHSIIKLLGEYRTRCLFSKVWALRDAAVSKIIMMISDFEMSPGISDAIVPLLNIVRHGLDDKMQHVYTNSCSLLENILASAQKNKVPRGNLSQIESIVNMLVERLADTNVRVQNASAHSLNEMLHNVNLVGPTIIAAHCLRPIPSKQLPNWRAIVGKLKLLSDCVSAFGVGDKHGLHHEQIMNFLKTIGAFTHSESKVRDAAKILTIAVQKHIGTPKIQEFLSDLPEKLLTQFNKEFDGQGGAASHSAAPLKGDHRDGNISNNKVPHNPKKATNTTNTNKVGHDQAQPKGGAGGGGGGAKNSSPQHKHHSPDHKSSHKPTADEDEVNFTKCLFCGKSDPTWLEDNLDLHYVNECPFLMSCPGCSQYIEVAAIPGHLLEECDRKGDYVECQKSGLAIRKDQYDDWCASSNCRAPPEHNLICPLCFETVEDSDESWKHHLIKGCKKHSRNNR